MWKEVITEGQITKRKSTLKSLLLVSGEEVEEKMRNQALSYQ